MATYETEYGIGDVVYTASVYGFEKQIITRVKVSGLKHSVSYGFKESGNSLWRLWVNGETWYKSSEVFSTQEKAERKHELLKEKQELEQKKDKLDELKELEDKIKELKEEL